MILQAMRPSDSELALALVTGIQVRNWASELVLECLDDPLTRRRYQLVFTNCREIRWSLDEALASSDDTEADVIGFCPGQAGHREPAVLTTDLFELSIVYDGLGIRELTGDPGHGRHKPAAARG